MSETKKLSNQDILYDLEQSNVRDDVFTQIKGIVENYEDMMRLVKAMEKQPKPDEDAIHDMCIDYWNEVDPEKMSTSYMIGLLSAKIRKLLGEK